MIIEVDGYFSSKKLYSKQDLPLDKIKQIYEKGKEQTNKTEQIYDLFKSQLGMAEVNEEDVHVDFVIDTDTDRIYKPNYY